MWGWLGVGLARIRTHDAQLFNQSHLPHGHNACPVLREHRGQLLGRFRSSVVALFSAPRPYHGQGCRSLVFSLFATPSSRYASIATSVHLMPPQRRLTRKKRKVLAVLIVVLAIYQRQRILHRRATEHEDSEQTSIYKPPMDGLWMTLAIVFFMMRRTL